MANSGLLYPPNIQGVVSLPGNYNVTARRPFDPRLVVKTKDDLLNFAETKPLPNGSSTTVQTLYRGAVVSVVDDPDDKLNGVYVLIDSDAGSESSWAPVGSDTLPKVATKASLATTGAEKGQIATVVGDGRNDGIYILTGSDAGAIVDWKQIGGNSVHVLTSASSSKVIDRDGTWVLDYSEGVFDVVLSGVENFVDIICRGNSTETIPKITLEDSLGSPAYLDFSDLTDDTIFIDVERTLKFTLLKVSNNVFTVMETVNPTIKANEEFKNRGVQKVSSDTNITASTGGLVNVSYPPSRSKIQLKLDEIPIEDSTTSSYIDIIISEVYSNNPTIEIAYDVPGGAIILNNTGVQAGDLYRILSVGQQWVVKKVGA